jgi:uncharacterized protein YndB with AHSA1/START domain
MMRLVFDPINRKDVLKMTTITKEIQIDVSKEKVWEILSNLETVQNYDPFVVNSFYTSDIKEGVGASRQCDLPEGGYIKERIIAWNPGEGYSLNVYEDGEPDSPLENQYAHFTLKEDGQGTTVTMTIEYDMKADAPVDPQEIEQMWRDEILPGLLAGLKHFVETGQPMPEM